MKQVKRLLTWMLLLGAIALHASPSDVSQKKVVTGTVTEKGSGDRLIGVSILLKGTSVGTITDVNGDYYYKYQEPDVGMHCG